MHTRMVVKGMLNAGTLGGLLVGIVWFATQVVATEAQIATAADEPVAEVQQQVKKPLDDGGFYFSPVILAANKGRIQRDEVRAYFRSYATASCDGLLALLSAGVDLQDERVLAARRWLESNPDWNYPAGIPRDHPEPWGDAVHYYRQAVRAEAYYRLRWPGEWAPQLIQRLGNDLELDGRIINRRSPLMKENDPLLCTTLALIAAIHAERHLYRELDN